MPGLLRAAVCTGAKRVACRRRIPDRTRCPIWVVSAHLAARPADRDLSSLGSSNELSFLVFSKEAVMIRCRVVVACLPLALAVCPVFAQAPTAKPGPEVQRLGYFVGRWSLAGEFKTEPLGKYAGTMACEWFEGGFVLICKGSSDGVRGAGSEMHILSYSAQDKAYNWYSVGTMGAARMVRRMTVEGKKWICDSDGTYQ